MDFHFILKTQNKEEELQKMLVESDGSQVYLGNLQNALIFGVFANKKENLGVFFKQAKMMHEFINQELKAICT
jgi:predicted regulator of Ras-like GTPase activity (Roadblock/LC7/MglB family)